MFKDLIRWYIRFRIHRAQYLYLNGDITMDEKDDIITRMMLLKYKWLKDECHHLCFKCEWKNRCYEEMNYKVKGV